MLLLVEVAEEALVMVDVGDAMAYSSIEKPRFVFLQASIRIPKVKLTQLTVVQPAVLI